MVKKFDWNLACHHKPCLFLHNCEVVEMVVTVGNEGAFPMEVMNENSYLTTKIAYNNNIMTI